MTLRLGGNVQLQKFQQIHGDSAAKVFIKLIYGTASI
jgi:hypothetical protein